MRRTVVISVILIAGLALVGALIASMVGRHEEDGHRSVPENRSQDTTTRNVNQSVSDSRSELLKIARVFGERYGTVDSAHPIPNPESLSALSTGSFRQAFAKQAANPPKTLADGTTVTSKAIAFNVVQFDDAKGRADVLVTLQRTEQVGTERPRTYRQDLQLQVLKESGSWKVDLAFWKPPQSL